MMNYEYYLWIRQRFTTIKRQSMDFVYFKNIIR